MPAIPVNLITGFLGVGKTTALRHLLAQRPRDQRWGVLINEFGEVGVDAALLGDGAAVVREVAGGCLCCVTAPLFTTALNRMIRQERPDRILIEPSGLGHPAQVLETLNGPGYAGVLDVRATICLVDARHLASVRHREHPGFQDQVHLADILVANKTDLYSDADRAAFTDFVLALDPPKQRLAEVTGARIDPDWLDTARGDGRHARFPEAHAFLVDQGIGAAQPGTTATADPWQRIIGDGDGYYRAGWYIGGTAPWDEDRLRVLLDAIAAERVKGIFPGARGWRAVNDGLWSDVQAPADGRARLEIIDAAPIAADRIDAGLRGLVGA
jgi:G3E family GTPase